MSKVTLINITNVNDGKTPLVRLDDITGELVIGKDTWRVVSASKFEELNKKVNGNIQKIDLTDEAYKKLTEVVNGNKIELDKKLSAEINDVYASLKGRSQNYSYNSSVEPQGQSNAKPIDELLKLAGENPSSDYHDVYRIWKGQITKSNPWKKVVEKHQGDIFNDMKTGNYYRFVYDEEKGTAFWLKGSNTAVSDLMTRLTVGGELITADKLSKMLASTSEFQQFKVVDTSKKKEIDRRLTELANEGQKSGTLLEEHREKLNKLSEFMNDPTIQLDNGEKSYIRDMINLADQKAKDAEKDLFEFKEQQKEVNINFTREVNNAKTTSKSDLEAESKRLAEFIKNAQETGNSALQAIGNYSRVNDSKVKKVENERAELEKKLNEFKDSSTVSLKEVSEQNKSLAFDLNSYKDSNRRTIQGLEGKVETVKKEAKEEITKVKKDISSITTNIIRKGTLRNGKVIGGIGGKVRLEMQVFYGSKDVTSIANDNECISWQLNDDYSRTSLGKIYDIDGATIMATNDQQVNVAGYLDKEKLLTIISPGLNMYLERNFDYQGYKFVPFDGSSSCYVKAHIYKDGIDITSQCSPIKIIAKGAGGYTKSNNDTVTFNAEDWRDGTPLFVELYDTTLGGAPLNVTEKITNGKDSEYVRSNLINQPNWDRTSNGNVHVTTDANKIIHWRGLVDSTAWYNHNLPIYYNVSRDKKYILKWNYKIISGEFEHKYIVVGGNRFYLKNADKKDGECYAIIQGCEYTYIAIHFSNIKTNEAEFWNFKLEEIKEGESEMPTDFCLSIEDIAKENEKLSKS